MKKITLLLLICFTFSFNSHAQLFSEDFSGSWQTTWDLIDEDGALVDMISPIVKPLDEKIVNWINN